MSLTSGVGFRFAKPAKHTIKKAGNHQAPAFLLYRIKSNLFGEQHFNLLVDILCGESQLLVKNIVGCGEPKGA